VAQPEYVPISAGDRVRPAERLPAHGGWTQRRPGDLKGPGAPAGSGFGSPGPDQGYALALAERFVDQLRLMPGEHADDAVAGALAVALRRASMFGRAPVVYDLELAYALWGYLGDAPPDLVEFRTATLKGAAHDYWVQRGAADKVRESTLRLTPAQVRAQLSSWRGLFE
jgi:hypothetical protein